MGIFLFRERGMLVVNLELQRRFVNFSFHTFLAELVFVESIIQWFLIDFESNCNSVNRQEALETTFTVIHFDYPFS